MFTSRAYEQRVSPYKYNTQGNFDNSETKQYFLPINYKSLRSRRFVTETFTANVPRNQKLVSALPVNCFFIFVPAPCYLIRARIERLLDSNIYYCRSG